MLGLPLHSLAQFTYQVTNSAGQTPTYKGRAAFSTNAEGVRVFNNEILVKAPSTGEYTSEFSSTLITLKPNVGVLIKTRAQTDVISGPEKLTVVSNFSAPGFLFQENCKEQNCTF